MKWIISFFIALFILFIVCNIIRSLFEEIGEFCAEIAKIKIPISVKTKFSKCFKRLCIAFTIAIPIIALIFACISGIIIYFEK